jgi:hypothetical protein
VLASFSLENFKSYEAATLPLAPLTVLVGANAAGKSNLIEAMQLLAWLARGRRLADLSAAMKSGELPIRGLLADVPLDPKREITLRCRIDAGDDLPTFKLSLGLRTDNGGPRIVSEELLVPDLANSAIPYYYRIDEPAASHGSEVLVAYNNFARGGKKPHIACVDQQAIFTQRALSTRRRKWRFPRRLSRCSGRSSLRCFSTPTRRKCVAGHTQTSTSCAATEAMSHPR